MDRLLTIATLWPIAVTKITDFIRNLVDRNDTAPKWVWNIVPFGLGVVISLTLEIDYSALIPALPEPMRNLSGTPAEILTGIGIGALGSFWHELMDWLSAAAKRWTTTGTQS